MTNIPLNEEAFDIACKELFLTITAHKSVADAIGFDWKSLKASTRKPWETATSKVLNAYLSAVSEDSKDNDHLFQALKTLTEIEKVAHKAGYNCTCASTPDNVTVDKDWLDVKLSILRGRLLLISEESISSKVEEFINQRPGYVTALRNTRGTDDQTDYWRWNGHAEARRQLADSLGWTVPYHQGETTQQEVDDD